MMANRRDLCHFTKSPDRAVKVLRRCVLRLWGVRERGQNRTAKFALIDSITRLFRRLIRFRKFIFGGADEHDSTRHVQLVKRGDIFDSLASWSRFGPVAKPASTNFLTRDTFGTSGNSYETMRRFIKSTLCRV